MGHLGEGLSAFFGIGNTIESMLESQPNSGAHVQHATGSSGLSIAERVLKEAGLPASQSAEPYLDSDDDDELFFESEMGKAEELMQQARPVVLFEEGEGVLASGGDNESSLVEDTVSEHVGVDEGNA